MPGAIFSITQDRTPDPPAVGSPGVAVRTLWVNRTVTLTVTTSGNSQIVWELLYKPTGSAATIVGTGSIVTLLPDLPGTYRVRLITNGGGPGNEMILLLAVLYDNSGALLNDGHRTPATGELAGESNWDGNTEGWAPDIDYQLAWLKANVDALLAMPGGGSAGTIFIFDPSAAPAYPVFTDFADLLTARNQVDGPATIVFVNAPSLPAGNHDLTDVTMYLADRLTLPLGVTLTDPSGVVHGQLVGDDGQIVLTGTRSFFIKDCDVSQTGVGSNLFDLSLAEGTLELYNSTLSDGAISLLVAGANPQIVDLYGSSFLDCPDMSGGGGTLTIRWHSAAARYTPVTAWGASIVHSRLGIFRELHAVRVVGASAAENKDVYATLTSLQTDLAASGTAGLTVWLDGAAGAFSAPAGETPLYGTVAVRGVPGLTRPTLNVPAGAWFSDATLLEGLTVTSTAADYAFRKSVLPQISLTFKDCVLSSSVVGLASCATVADSIVLRNGTSVSNGGAVAWHVTGTLALRLEDSCTLGTNTLSGNGTVNGKVVSSLGTFNETHAGFSGTLTVSRPPSGLSPYLVWRPGAVTAGIVFDDFADLHAYVVAQGYEHVTVLVDTSITPTATVPAGSYAGAALRMVGFDGPDTLVSMELAAGAVLSDVPYFQDLSIYGPGLSSLLSYTSAGVDFVRCELSCGDPDGLLAPPGSSFTVHLHDSILKYDAGPAVVGGTGVVFHLYGKTTIDSNAIDGTSPVFYVHSSQAKLPSQLTTFSGTAVVHRAASDPLVADLVATSNINLAAGGTVTVDGTSSDGKLILCKGQTSALEGGVYLGNPLGAWTRVAAFNDGNSIYTGRQVYVREGTTYANTLWLCEIDTAFFEDGSTNVTFAQAGGGATMPVGATGTVLAGTGASSAFTDTPSLTAVLFGGTPATTGLIRTTVETSIITTRVSGVNRNVLSTDVSGNTVIGRSGHGSISYYAETSGSQSFFFDATETARFTGSGLYFLLNDGAGIYAGDTSGLGDPFRILYAVDTTTVLGDGGGHVIINAADGAGLTIAGSSHGIALDAQAAATITASDTCTSFTLTQASSSGAATGAPLSVTAQSSTALNSTGGYAYFGSGAGTLANGEVRVGTGGTTRMTLTGTGKTLYWAADLTTNVSLTQADNTTNSATGTRLDIASQKATGTTSIGGELRLTASDGTSRAGYLTFYRGTTQRGQIGTGSAGHGGIWFGRSNTISANDAFAAGSNNNITNDYSTAIGVTNSVSGSVAIAIGGSNIASADYTCTIGYSNVASVFGAVAVGNQNTSSGNSAFSAGILCTAANVAALALGYYAYAASYAELAHASGNAPGSPQNSRVQISGVTAASASTSVDLKAGPSADQEVITRTGRIYSVRVVFVATSTTFGTVGRIELTDALIKNSGGTVSVIDAGTSYLSATTPTDWGIALSGSGANLRVTFSKTAGAVALRCSALVELVDVAAP